MKIIISALAVLVLMIGAQSTHAVLDTSGQSFTYHSKRIENDKNVKFAPDVAQNILSNQERT